jgi:DNA-directed RNA polymerase specialized sigma24 family protein
MRTRRAGLTDETACVLRAQCGDRDALELLLRRLQPRLHRYLSRLVGVDQAPDVLQDVLVSIARKLTWLAEPRLLGPWAFRIASRAAFRHLRRQRRWRRYAAAMMAVAAHTGPVSSDAFLLKTLYVASAAQMLFVACCTAGVLFQFTRMMKSILRAIELK